MLDDEVNLFLRRLAETVAWCEPRASVDDPRDSLRMLCPPDTSLFDLSDTNVYAAVLDVAERRSLALVRAGGTSRPMHTVLNAALRRGRLLGYWPHGDLHDGPGEPASTYFLDFWSAPPCDTWVWAEPTDVGQFISGPTPLVIAWIPAQFVDLVEAGMRVQTASSLYWTGHPRANTPLLQEARRVLAI